MFGYLPIVAILLGQVEGSDIRVRVPTTPFECAHSRSFRFDDTGRILIGVTQSGEMLAWGDDAEKPVVTKLEKKAGGDRFDGVPMSAVVAHEGRDVVIFYYDGTAHVWNVETGTKIKELEGDRRDFGYAHASPNGDLVACLSYGREGKSSAILFWNTSDWTSAGKIETSERINDFCFTADSQDVRTCVGHPTDQRFLGFTGIIGWNVASKEEVGRVDYGPGFPIRIAVSPDGRWLATGGGDAIPVSPIARNLRGHLRIFDWKQKTFVKELYTLPSDYVRAVQFSPDSQHLYSGSYIDPPMGGESLAGIKAFRVEDWVAEWTATLGSGNPHELTVSPNGKDILVPDSKHLQIIDAKDGAVRGAKLTFHF